jgi:hypothetical protein
MPVSEALPSAVAAPRRWRHVLPAAFCVVGVALAVGALSWRDHARRPHYIFTTQLETPLPHVVSADDCPLDLTCVAVPIRTRVDQLASSAFPGSSTVHSDALSDERDGTVRESLDLRTSAGVAVRVATRCVDGGSQVAGTRSADVPSTGPATVFVVVAGKNGCSAAVVLDVPSGVAVPWVAATALAQEPALQLGR